MKRLHPLFRIIALLIVASAVCGVCYVIYWLLGRDALVMPLTLALFGLWSLLCVYAGARLSGGASSGPLPLMTGEDVAKWIGTGKTPGEPDIEETDLTPPQQPRQYEL